MMNEIITQSPQQLPPLTFEALLTMISEADDALTMDLDPAALVGELRDKVDALKAVLDRLENLEAFMGMVAAPFLAKKKAAANNARRLKDYIATHMREKGFEKVPGVTHRVQLQDAPPALEMAVGTPTEAHAELFPEYVTEHRELRWRSDKIKEDLLSGDLPEDGCTFAKIRVTRYARFYMNTPEKLPAAKKGKKA